MTDPKNKDLKLADLKLTDENIQRIFAEYVGREIALNHLPFEGTVERAMEIYETHKPITDPCSKHFKNCFSVGDKIVRQLNVKGGIYTCSCKSYQHGAPSLLRNTEVGILKFIYCKHIIAVLCWREARAIAHRLGSDAKNIALMITITDALDNHAGDIPETFAKDRRFQRITLNLIDSVVDVGNIL